MSSCGCGQKLSTTWSSSLTVSEPPRGLSRGFLSSRTNIFSRELRSPWTLVADAPGRMCVRGLLPESEDLDPSRVAADKLAPRCAATTAHQTTQVSGLGLVFVCASKLVVVLMLRHARGVGEAFGSLVVPPYLAICPFRRASHRRRHALPVPRSDVVATARLASPTVLRRWLCAVVFCWAALAPFPDVQSSPRRNHCRPWRGMYAGFGL
jgi:hypothetical protein